MVDPFRLGIKNEDCRNGIILSGSSIKLQGYLVCEYRAGPINWSATGDGKAGLRNGEKFEIG